MSCRNQSTGGRCKLHIERPQPAGGIKPRTLSYGTKCTSQKLTVAISGHQCNHCRGRKHTALNPCCCFWIVLSSQVKLSCYLLDLELTTVTFMVIQRGKKISEPALSMLILWGIWKWEKPITAELCITARRSYISVKVRTPGAGYSIGVYSYTVAFPIDLCSSIK